jgi:hypothetical protein
MIWSEANALHNPFLRGGSFRTDLQIDCTKSEPDELHLSGSAIVLVFPNQAWIEAASSSSTIRALFLDRPKTKDLSPLANLPLFNLTVSYPSHVKDWGFLERFPSLLRLSLHNTLSITSLESVGKLRGLEVFQLSGGYSKCLRLPSLVPLACCENLRVIDLANVRCADPSLRPLLSLSALRRFDCPLYWPADEVQALLCYNTALHSNFMEKLKR